MRDNVAVAWRRALFVLLAAVLALGAVPSQALAEMAEEAMGEEPVAAQAEGPGEARAEGLVAQGGPEVAGDPAGVAGGEPGLSTQSVGRLYGPRVVESPDMSSGQVVTWDCVWLGSYPQTEVAETDALKSADWADGDATVDGVRYRRIAKSDATYSGYWSDDGYGSAAYRYFRYEPVKWRILKADGDAALAVADVALDCRQYHKSYADVTWETSAVRSWLNGTGAASYYTSGAQSGRTAQAFAEVAFTAEQLGAVRESTIANANNTYSNTSGGSDTADRVFLLSEAEVHGAPATAHGFVSGPGTLDEARRCRPSDYARAMGAQVPRSGSYAGNCCWWLRSPGGSAYYAAYVYYDGDANCSGYHVDLNNCAVRPALNLNLSSPHLAWAGTVSSDGAADADARPGSARLFPDVPADSWCSGVVYRAATLGLMGGYDDGNFGPDDPVTRGQAAVVLWSMADRPGAGAGARDFPDVSDEGAYHYNAVRWASSAGVASGYENGNFGPDDNVTREQLAAMLANYARNVAGLAVEGTAGDYAGMGDGADVSPWAVSSVGWCFGSGILSGTGDGNILPKGSATRAEAAKMLVGLYDLLA